MHRNANYECVNAIYKCSLNLLLQKIIFHRYQWLSLTSIIIFYAHRGTTSSNNKTKRIIPLLKRIVQIYEHIHVLFSFVSPPERLTNCFKNKGLHSNNKCEFICSLVLEWTKLAQDVLTSILYAVVLWLGQKIQALKCRIKKRKQGLACLNK